jgi:ATP-dependent DNA ligase
VSYAELENHRLRHRAKFIRWRPDRDPASCLVDQLDDPAAAPADVLSTFVR